MRFKDKVCIVTGGGSGIGRATCIRLASEGGTVIIADRDKSAEDETAGMICEAGGEALCIATDIGRPDEVEQCVNEVIRKFGKIDVLVNNAAMMTFDPVADLKIEQWDMVMAVNLRSVFLFCKLALPYMNRASVVNISSVHAHQTTPNVIPYATSKAGIESFTRGMSREYPAEKARFNSVAPGAVDTPMLWSNPNVKSGKEKIEGAIGTPRELASAICFLASDEASYINGSTLVVDGGRLEIL